ncbi:MAG: transporter substrate-binding domain-containing protein [Pseudomonadota bacterium]
MASLVPVLCATWIAAHAEPIDVYTDYWPPYVNHEGEELGEAARIVRLALDNMDADVRWRYFDFAYGYHKVRNDKAPLSFPWFWTNERADEVAFSKPLIEATSRVYFNRQFNKFVPGEPVDFGTCRLAKVAGYRYGPEVDAVFETAEEIQTEIDAIAALLNGDIDLLPMTERVADAILRANFADRRLLLLSLDAPVATSNLYAVAPNTPEGEERLQRFNQSLVKISELGLVDLPTEPAAADDPAGEGATPGDAVMMQSCAPPSPSPSECVSGADPACELASQGVTQDDTQVVATIVTSEGFPAAIADDLSASQRVPLVRGTRVFVIQWQATGVAGAPEESSPRVFDAMTQPAEVVVLNGPYVGRQVLIPQMHLAIVE